ncbi:uncharacterized protein LOC121992343 isoform X2 [Zingiber officinale]|uniref:uncharacterized protein LOC121992343 isoform X2 n=1 Tax=Zingiber officinale TaxID=94328 RepID=UPI001C4D22C0|nr:uncharacterized protein LOC121992343 isoform X2 [Zingiber officinale]
MGDLESWPPLADADASGGHESLYSHPQLPNPHPSVIKAENWKRAEEATREVLWCIRPTVVSEERRKAVVDYVQELLRTRMGSRVFPFGSVPLKTYLPDGDIDLTALGAPNNKDMLASELCSVLGEEHNKVAGFEVNDVQLIRAEVKVVKCIMQNIVVDISFNQIGGLCTLCFLEKINEKIGKDHLFKRSIILIKAWCYYESRILGAHHGLISTYALEILVLHVFHLFHEQMDDPLAVLYRFLDYYSKFDWSKYCITLQSAISISSLPKLVEPSETKGNYSPLTEEFIEECVEMFSVPSRMYENSCQAFTQKYLNIVDPLKPSNNLGRSVSKSNFHRIRSAFTFGARKLGRILQSSSENIVDEVNLFFRNTLCRHGTGERPDVQDAISSSPKSGSAYHVGVKYRSSNLNAEYLNKDSHFSGLTNHDSSRALIDVINNINCFDLGEDHISKKQDDKHSANPTINVNNSRSGSVVFEEDIISKHSTDDAIDLPSTRAFDSRSLDESFKPSTSGKVFHAPHLFFCSNNNQDDNILGNSSTRDNVMVGMPSNKSTSPCNEMGYEVKSTNSASWPRKSTLAAPSSFDHESPSSSWNCRDSSLGGCTNDGKLDDASSSSDNLSDLSGDFQLYCSNLLHAQEFQECFVNSCLVPVYHASSSPYQNKHSWNMQSMYAHGANGLVHMPSLPPSYYVIPPLICNDYGVKDITKTRGTGTYLPNTNSRSYRERQFSGRGWNQMQANHLHRYHRNGHGNSPYYEGSSDERNHVPPPPPLPASFFRNGHGDAIPLDHPKSPGSAFMVVSPDPEGKLGFDNFGPVTMGVSSSERSSNRESANAVDRGSRSSIPASTVERPHRSLNNERLTQPYQLKDDGDFPPLAG